MQAKYQNSIQDIEKVVLKILKQKNQWLENVTQIHIQKWTIKNIEVYLIEINIISSTMILSENWPIQMSKKQVVFAFKADIQKSGRGQRQNLWESPSGNLYLTLLFQFPLEYFPYLPIISIDNVYKVIKSQLTKYKAEAITQIKWINDILIDYQKVSGVLIKNQIHGQNLYSQIGIGVNVKNLPENTKEIKQTITFLEKYTKHSVQIHEFCKNMITQFVRTFCEQKLNIVKLQAKQDYEKNLAYLNKEVVIWDYKYEKILGVGKFLAINQYGHAIISGHQKAFVQGRMKREQKVI